jgi:hypothetical protein
MTAVEQLTFGNEPAAVRAAVRPSGPGYEIERELAAAGGPAPTSRASCPCYDLGCRDEASDANTTVELR